VLDSLVKALTILGCVVEPELCREDVVAKVGESGIPSGLLPKLIHVVEEPCQLVSAIDIRLAGYPERPLAHRTVRALEEGL
jgi:hypothetical protein